MRRRASATLRIAPRRRDSALTHDGRADARVVSETHVIVMSADTAFEGLEQLDREELDEEDGDVLAPRVGALTLTRSASSIELFRESA